MDELAEKVARLLEVNARLRERIKYAAEETSDPHTARTLNGVLRQTAMFEAAPPVSRR